MITRLVSVRARGFALAFLGVLVLSPDALLVRVIRAQGWDLLFWRGLLQGIALGFCLLVWYRRSVITEMRSGGVAAIWSTLVLTAVAICFVMALQGTSVANVLVIIAISPILASLISWFWFGERTGAITWLVMLAAAVGVAVIFYDRIGQYGLTGELFALGCAAGHALNWCIIRQSKNLNPVGPLTASAFLVSLVALLAGAEVSIGLLDARWTFILGLIVLPVSFALLMMAPRYITAPEVGIMMVLEVVLGPFWVWIAISEEPSVAAIGGGLIISCAILGHCVYSIRRDRISPQVA